MFKQFFASFGNCLGVILVTIAICLWHLLLFRPLDISFSSSKRGRFASFTFNAYRFLFALFLFYFHALANFCVCLVLLFIHIPFFLISHLIMFRVSSAFDLISSSNRALCFVFVCSVYQLAGPVPTRLTPPCFSPYAALS